MEKGLVPPPKIFEGSEVQVKGLPPRSTEHTRLMIACIPPHMGVTIIRFAVIRTIPMHQYMQGTWGTHDGCF